MNHDLVHWISINVSRNLFLVLSHDKFCWGIVLHSRRSSQGKITGWP